MSPLLSVVRAIFQSREMVIFGVLILEILAFAAIDARHPGEAHFVSVDALLGAAQGVSLIGIAAVGTSLVIISGGIDLSPGAVYGLCGVVFMLAMVHHVPPLAAALLAGGAGLIFGLVNGSAVAFCRIPPFIATLGTLGIARGLAYLLTNGEELPSADLPLPDSGSRLLDVLDTHFFKQAGQIGITLGFVTMVALAALFTVWLQWTRAGRYVMAVGGSEEVARFAGVRVGATKLMVYVIASGLAAVTGLFYVSRYDGINSGVGPGDELNIIAAAVVGGVSLAGGKGSPAGAVIGAVIIKVLNDGLVFNEVPQAGAQIAVGIFIICAVLIDRLLQTVRGRAAARAPRRQQNGSQ